MNAYDIYYISWIEILQLMKSTFSLNSIKKFHTHSKTLMSYLYYMYIRGSRMGGGGLDLTPLKKSQSYRLPYFNGVSLAFRWWTALYTGAVLCKTKKRRKKKKRWTSTQTPPTPSFVRYTHTHDLRIVLSSCATRSNALLWYLQLHWRVL